jgi:lipid II:glycine glycyltransferase (peptidoglycan interpeptide bridge formation enzyme)
MSKKCRREDIQTHMIIREINEKERQAFDTLATHPLQSYAWGEFRKETGVKVVRVGEFDNDNLIRGYQLTIHKIPKSPFTVGYFPKGPNPDKEMLSSLVSIGKQYNCIFIRLEPNTTRAKISAKDIQRRSSLIHIPQKGFFTKYSFVLDITSSEEELLKNMKEKTRYNIRLATRKGVSIQEETSEKAFNEYLRLTFETTKRQKFFAHNETYHRTMWKILSSSGIAHLFTATYENKTLVTWVVFLFNNVLYYPYGASSSEHREVMASNLMMWEVIKWGKDHGATSFDMWGALPPDADPKDPQMGFHRFKEGYGGILTEFTGTVDLVIHPLLYQLYLVTDKLRWILLRLKQ